MTTILGRKLNGKPWMITAGLTGPGSGLSGTATVDVSGMDAARPYRRATTTGGAFGKGVGPVKVTLTASNASSGLFAQLYDATTGAGAAAATPGTGPLLVPTFQAANSVASGSQTLAVQVPAGLKPYYMDLALSTDAANNLVNPVRVSKSFGMGMIHLIGGHSHTARMVGIHNLQPPNLPPVHLISPPCPYGSVYALKSTTGAIYDLNQYNGDIAVGNGTWGPRQITGPARRTITSAHSRLNCSECCRTTLASFRAWPGLSTGAATSTIGCLAPINTTVCCKWRLGSITTSIASCSCLATARLLSAQSKSRA
ncbi:MAG: hypothetical protein NVSMB18_16490 [Acetobacteraceae bacterium]